MMTSPEYPDLQWIPPRSYTPGRKTGQPTKIVIHYTAGREGFGDVDVNDSIYCQRRTDGTSAHYFIDGDSVTHCVRTTDESHTALAHGNDDGIHYELCGTAQTRAQWLDPASRATIRLAAKQAARDMRKYNIPLRRLVNAQVRDRNAKGICGHVDMTYGWPEDGGTHTDPGPQFPWDVLFSDIQAELDGDDNMSLTTEEHNWLWEVRELLHEGKRLGTSQTGGGGIPHAWIVKKVQEIQAAQALTHAEVDTLEEGNAALLAAVSAIQAGDVNALAEALSLKLAPEVLAGLIDALERVRLTVGE